MFILAQVFRVIGSIFCLIADSSSNKKKIFFYNGIYNFFSGLQYLLLNAITGAICSFVALLRNIVFYRYKDKTPLSMLLIYFVVLVGVNITSITSFITFIPILLVIMYSTALYIGNVTFIKLTVITVCILEIIYDFIVNAYVGIAFCIINIILVSLSLRKRKER